MDCRYCYTVILLLCVCYVVSAQACKCCDNEEVELDEGNANYIRSVTVCRNMCTQTFWCCEVIGMQGRHLKLLDHNGKEILLPNVPTDPQLRAGRQHCSFITIHANIPYDELTINCLRGTYLTSDKVKVVYRIVNSTCPVTDVKDQGTGSFSGIQTTESSLNQTTDPSLNQTTDPSLNGDSGGQVELKVWLTPVALIAAVLLVVLVILAVVFRQKVMGLLSSVYTAIRSCICCENNNTEEHIPESGGDAGGNAGGNAGGDAGVGGAGDQQEDKGDDVSIQLDDTVASDVPLPLPVKEETEYSETGHEYVGYHRTPPHAAPRRNSLDVPYVGITNVGFYFSLKQELEKPVSFGRVFEDNHDELMKKGGSKVLVPFQQKKCDMYSHHDAEVVHL